MTTTIDGDGTDEAEWRPWLDRRPWPPLDLARLHGRRVVVLAAHPDDEVLGVGGLLQQLSVADAELICVWATDGEASHPGSLVFTRATLAARRREESQSALGRLGLTPFRSVHLGLPDGQVAAHHPELMGALRRIVTDHDLVIAPWRFDGHPDHDAVGRAAAELDLSLLEYPVWMWHWARPDDSRVPWHRARTVDVADVAAKAAAIAAFTTQIAPIGPDRADAAILPAHVLARFQRPSELVFQ